jgi:5-methylcytosine-specific restriction endonuclease McrA
MPYKNPEDARARQQRYNEANRENKRQYARWYYGEHRERLLEEDHIAYVADPEKRLTASREYGKAHPKERLQKFLKWLKTPNGIAYNRARKHRGRTTGKLNILAFYMGCAELGWHCQMCGKELTKETVTIDHILPVSKGGTNTIENLQPLCRSCNGKKGNRSMAVMVGPEIERLDTGKNMKQAVIHV